MDIYIREGFASFGWYTMEFAPWVYRPIGLTVLVLAAAALIAFRRHHGVLGAARAPMALIVLAIAGVLAGGLLAAPVALLWAGQMMLLQRFYL